MFSPGCRRCYSKSATSSFRLEQEHAYWELKHQFVTELEGEEFAALHVLSRVTKLLEITSGFLYRDDEPTYVFKQSSKVAELKDVLGADRR